MTDQRSLGVDLVRAVGITAIVVAHVWPTRNAFYTWHVPVFFVLTGYLWKDGRSFASEVQRRTQSLVLPYVSWMVLVLAVWAAFLTARGEPGRINDWQTLVRGGYSLITPFAAFWFVTALLVAVLVARLLQPLSLAAVWAVGAGALWWAGEHPVAVRSTWLAAGQGLVGVFFVAGGILLRDARRRHPRLVVLGPPLLLGSFLLGYERVFSYVDLKAGYVGTPFLSALTAVGISWGLVLVLEAVAPHVPPALAAGPRLVARYGLAVILGHSLVLGVAAVEGQRQRWWLPVVALLAPLAVAWCADRTPARRLLLGSAASGPPGAASSARRRTPAGSAHLH